jgi:arabinogalactan oligomer/maltooligosaccharide transport system substrate-binding protein
VKKLYWSIVVLLALALIAAGCGGGGAAQPTSPPSGGTQPTNPPAAQATNPPAAQPTNTTAAGGATGKNVKLVIWHQWNGEYLKAITAAFDDYTKAHPNVTFDLSKPDKVQESLKVAIPAGQGPDIIGWANDNIGTQAIAGNIVALNDYGIDENFLKSTYEPAAVKGVVWQGKIWALPESQEGIALVYNKALVQASDLPSDPNDLNGLLQKAKDFQAKTGKFLVCNQGFGAKDAYHVAPVFFGFGVPTYVDDQGKVYLNTPEAIKAAQWLADFSKVSPKEASYDICKAMLTEGKAGAWWTGPWAIADIEKAKVDYGIQPMGKPFVGIKVLMLTKNAVDRKNQDVALDVIKYFTSADVQKKIAVANKTIPAPTGAVKDPDVQKLATLAGFGQALSVGVPMANTPYANAQWEPVGAAATAVWTGAQKPDQAMAAAQKAIEDAIKQMK